MSDRPDDDFLSALREPPRRDWAAALRQRLAAQQAQSSRPAPAKMGWRAAWVAALCLLVALGVGGSPVARAQAGAWLRAVGGLLFEERADVPEGIAWGAAAPHGQRVVPLQEARAALPFGLPSWAPNGFQRLDEAILAPPSELLPFTLVALAWCDPASGECIRLLVDDAQRDANRWLVGDGSVEEARVNGQPAALVRGAWDPATERWSAGDVLTLGWRGTDGLTYFLMASEGVVEPPQLRRMAESLR